MYKIEFSEAEEISRAIDGFHGPLPQNLDHNTQVYQSIVHFFVEKIVAAYDGRGMISTNLSQPSINPRARAKLQEILSTYQSRENTSTLLSDIGSRAKDEVKMLLNQASGPQK